MKIIKEKKYKLIMADFEKHIRQSNDVYIPEHFDEDGNLIPEHFPEYYEMLYVSKKLSDEEIMLLYIEEDKNKEIKKEVII